MSDESVTRQQPGLIRRQKRAVRTSRSPLKAALVANTLCRGREKLMMREREVQIGNSGLGLSLAAA